MNELGVRLPVWALDISDRGRKENESHCPFSAWRDFARVLPFMCYLKRRRERLSMWGFPWGEMLVSAIFTTHQPCALHKPAFQLSTSYLFFTHLTAICLSSRLQMLPWLFSKVHWVTGIQKWVKFSSFDSSRLHHSTASHLYFLRVGGKLLHSVNYSCSLSIEKSMTPRYFCCSGGGLRGLMSDK